MGRELRLDSGLVLETLVGCLGLGWQPWAGLASAPLPSSSQTSICLLTSWPPRPFQFPGRSSVGQRKAVTCPAMATGATGPLLFWAEGLGDLGTSWGRHEHLRGSAGVPRVGSLPPLRAGAFGTQQAPAGGGPCWLAPILLALEWPAGRPWVWGSGPLPALCCLQRGPGGGGTGCLLHQGAGLLLSTVEGLRPTSCKPEKRSSLACPVWLSEALGRSPNGQASVSSLTGLEFRAWFPGRAQ